MRSKILQLKRIRELRAQQKQRETMAAKAATVAADRAFEALGLEYRTVQRDIKATRSSFSSPGATISGNEIERRLERIKRLEGYLRSMVPRVKAADQTRKMARQELEAAQARQKAADRALDQMAQLDARLEAEETAAAERLEEMSEEPRSKRPIAFEGEG